MLHRHQVNMFCCTRITQHCCRFIASQRDYSRSVKPSKISSNASRKPTKPRNAIKETGKRRALNKKITSQPRLRIKPSKTTIKKRAEVSQRSDWTSILLRYCILNLTLILFHVRKWIHTICWYLIYKYSLHKELIRIDILCRILHEM